MSGKNKNFGDRKIKKRDVYKSKNTFEIYDIDINKKLVSKETSC